jgi:CheY-like chemotaxis protein
MNSGLPGISAIEIMQLIKNKPSYKNVPVIASTDMIEHKKKLLEAGFSDFISKPISMRDFMKILEKYRM